VMLALAVFGIGQGLFISPNNSAVVAAAPASLTGEAGGLLNVMRSCGISIGVAGASALLAWRLAAHTGSGHNTLHAEAQQLLAAGRDVIVLIGSFAAMAGVISLARVPARRPGDAKDASAQALFEALTRPEPCSHSISKLTQRFALLVCVQMPL